MSKAARTAAISASPITAAATGIVPNARVLRRGTWLAEREADLLPVGYFHVVFSLPAEIAAIAWQNKAPVYDLLFRAAAETMMTIAADASISAPGSASPPCSTHGVRP